MPKRVPLPATLKTGPFRVRDTELGEGRLRGSDLARPFHGVRSAHMLDFIETCRAYLTVAGESHHFSHLTAARVWGCPLPREWEAHEPLHVTVVPPTRAPRGRGVIGHEIAHAHVRDRHGLPVSDPASSWIALATLLPLDELVVCGDHLVLDPVVLDPHDPRPYVSLTHLQDRVRDFHGRGARAASSAIRLVRQGAEARPETLLRLLLVRNGMPEPLVNVDVFDRNGRWLGRGDLVYPEWRTIIEYDGDGHRTDTRQYDRDITRIDDFIHGDWSVVRVRSRGLFVSPQQTIARVQRVLMDRGWRPN